MIFILALLILPWAYCQDILLSDFEQSTYVWLPTGGAWTKTGTCFGTGPAQGTLSGQNAVTGYLGSKLVNTYLGGDASTGTLTSPSFTITRKYIRFLIGAGNRRTETTINLIVGGQVVRSAVGMGDRETLDWLQWNVNNLLNQTAQIQIVESTGAGWGHLNVDHIIATDASLASVIIPNKKYLLLPVKTGASKVMVELVQEGLVVREMGVELSTTPDYWAFIDMAPYTGKELVVRMNSALATPAQLTSYFIQSDVITASTPIYEETLRPIYHYTSKRGFLSDPNDLVYKNGEYHLGYQHNPVGWAWDNMTHGHAVSTDLVHWTELPDAINETYWGEAWNGSSVVDATNTAGFGSGAIVNFYTSAAGYADNPRMSAPNSFAQSLTYSTDNGRTFNYYANNPVVPHITGSNHDPVVFWYAPGNVWVMVLYVENSDYHIFNSTNLKTWTYKSKVSITGTTEVPDLFELPVDGNPGNKKWVFSAGYRQYVVGTFNGSTFTKEYGPFWYGRQQWDMAAALTFNNTPDGRRIMMSNGRTEYPGMPFNRYMNLPNVLTLKTLAGVPKLHINPVAEVANLRTSTQTWGAQTLNTGVNLMNGISGEGVEMEIVFTPQSRSLVEFRVGEFWVAYNKQQNKIGVGSNTDGGQWRSLSPMADGKVHIRAFYDRGSWEVFANGGELYYPRVLTPKAGDWALNLNTKNASINIVSLQLHKMGSMWGVSSARAQTLTAINEGSANADGIVTVYPNPVTEGYFIVDRSAFKEKELMITLFDLSGQELFKRMLSDDETRVDLSDDLRNGIYLLVINGRDTTYNGRLLIE